MATHRDKKNFAFTWRTNGHKNTTSFIPRDHGINHVSAKSRVGFIGSLNDMSSSFGDFQDETTHMVRNCREAESYTNRCLRMQIRL